MIGEELDLTKIINCHGTLTVLGGNTVDEEIIDAMKEAASSYFDMPELHRKAGKYVADLLGVEDVYIVNGAEAGLVLSLAACMTRGDIEKMVSLPKPGAEVIVQSKHRNMYDYILGFTGAKVVEAGDKMSGTTFKDFESLISDRTVALIYFAYDPQEGVLPLEKVSKLCHSRGIPVIVDAAAELPPKENFQRFVKLGADLVLFSGGKDIGAPNDTGLVLGKGELVEACRKLGPHSYIQYQGATHVFIGRPMKTSKEDVFAFIAALKKYLVIDDRVRLSRWEEMARYLVKELQGIDGVARAGIVYDGVGQPRPAVVPKVEVKFSENLSAEGVRLKLRSGVPSIVAYVLEDMLYVNTQCLKDGEEKIVIDKIDEIANSPR